ncbi:hypothetical protein RSOLAG1IB_06965 [Rhizoctonia solani AG-1 IB]|uniref:Uncharacterized protein n=1 Tax=Thanatephorus cucumeris (strain AG1-IB / isolate 7/3/14) TaxID=1108050 RepID=A0A0B7F9U4_THACB|nr:hypothetical protein RSOLAG1IB_06965 [Rhizoctonia solani AG-1 IB]
MTSIKQRPTSSIDLLAWWLTSETGQIWTVTKEIPRQWWTEWGRPNSLLVQSGAGERIVASAYTSKKLECQPWMDKRLGITDDNTN